MFDLELGRVIKKIQDSNTKLVLVQLPDGLKPKATKICKEIENETNALCIIWAGSCFGACDIPKVNADLIVQWGHSEMRYGSWS